MNSANDEVSLDGLRGRRREARDRRVARRRDGRGEPTVTYKLRDWLFSRQRYWGEPFPIVYDDIGPIALPGVAAAGRAARDHQLRARDLRRSRRAAAAAARARRRLGRGRARPPGDGVGRPRRGPTRLPPRDQHDAAVGRIVLVLPALPRPHQRGRARRSRRSSANGRKARASTARRSRVSSTSTSAASSTRCCTCSTRASGTRCCYDLGHVSTVEPFQRLVNQGMILAAAYTDERGIYVEASEVEERDGAFLYRGRRR